MIKNDFSVSSYFVIKIFIILISSIVWTAFARSLWIFSTCNCNHHCAKMKFSIKGFFSKCDQIRSFLWIWSHLLKKPLTENFIFLWSELYWLLSWDLKITSEKTSTVAAQLTFTCPRSTIETLEKDVKHIQS